MNGGAFLDKLLEPLPAEGLIDIGLNRDLRKARGHVWRRAMNAYEAADALRRFYWTEVIRFSDFEPNARKAKANVRFELNLRDLQEERGIALMRTPAPDKEALAWKHRRSTRLAFKMPKAEIDALIAADEAFLVAHPMSWRRRAGQNTATNTGPSTPRSRNILPRKPSR